jgi:hypothetical protein
MKTKAWVNEKSPMRPINSPMRATYSPETTLINDKTVALFLLSTCLWFIEREADQPAGRHRAGGGGDGQDEPLLRQVRHQQAAGRRGKQVGQPLGRASNSSTGAARSAIREFRLEHPAEKQTRPWTVPTALEKMPACDKETGRGRRVHPWPVMAFCQASDRRTATRQQPAPAIIAGPERAWDEHCSAHTIPPHRMRGALYPNPGGCQVW